MPIFFAGNAIYPIDLMPEWLKGRRVASATLRFRKVRHVPGTVAERKMLWYLPTLPKFDVLAEQACAMAAAASGPCEPTTTLVGAQRRPRPRQARIVHRC